MTCTSLTLGEKSHKEKCIQIRRWTTVQVGLTVQNPDSDPPNELNVFSAAFYAQDDYMATQADCNPVECPLQVTHCPSPQGSAAGQLVHGSRALEGWPRVLNLCYSAGRNVSAPGTLRSVSLCQFLRHQTPPFWITSIQWNLCQWGEEERKDRIHISDLSPPSQQFPPPNFGTHWRQQAPAFHIPAYYPTPPADSYAFSFAFLYAYPHAPSFASAYAAPHTWEDHKMESSGDLSFSWLLEQRNYWKFWEIHFCFALLLMVREQYGYYSPVC